MSAAASPAQAVRSAVPSAVVVATYQAQLVRAVNVQRAQHGRRPVTGWVCLDRFAESWSHYLARTQLLTHRPLMVAVRACAATRVVENLARAGVTPTQVVAMWMASPGHRVNLLDRRVSRVGVGATYAGGQWTVVLNLARP